LINKKDLMGDYTNSRFFNVVAWAATILMIVLTVGWFWTLRAA
jgi:Mn2+/Fe2+ NRAMP family transporter